MQARIYSPSKTAMQSGKSKTNTWVLEFEPTSPRYVEPLMGYTTSNDMGSQVILKFSTLELAKAYAEKEGIVYTVQKSHEPRRRKMAYSDNFAFIRTLPWTH